MIKVAVSNIITDFVRIHAWAGHGISRAEAEWISERLLSDRGSYWVPVTIHLAPSRSHVDIQYGSGKSTGMVEFWADYGDQYDAVWTRSYDPARSFDLIWSGDPNTGYRQARSCRYAFDEVRVTGPAGGLPAIGGDARGPRNASGDWQPYADGVWRSLVRGSYLTCNSRVDMNTGPRLRGVDWNAPRISTRPSGLSTPTTPCYDSVSIEVLEPAELAVLTTGRSTRPPARRVEFFWQGRLVHRAQEDHDDFLGERTWQHRSADGWDNCADPEFLSYSRPHPLTSTT